MEQKDFNQFIHFVNQNKSLTRQQVLRRNRLLARDCMQSPESEVLKNAEDNKHHLVIINTGNQNTRNIISNAQARNFLFGTKHNPSGLVNFLTLFTKDGCVLKYTTHPWESGLFDSFSEFYEKYRKVIQNAPFWKFKPGKASEIFTCTPHIFNLIQSFLFKSISDQYFWGKGYKIGYKTDNIVEKWMEANPGKQPYSMPISEIPEGLIPKKERDKMVYFEDIVNVFKELIEFRGNNLYHTLRRAFTHPDLNVNKQLLDTLKGKSFYSDTDYVSKAIEAIASNIITRHEYPVVDIFAEYRNIEGTTKKAIELHILHKESFADCDIDSDKLMLRGKGGMLDIKRHLVSLCDFSIISRFDVDGVKKSMQIDYLYDEDINKAPRKINCIEEAKGFEYILTFFES